MNTFIRKQVLILFLLCSTGYAFAQDTATTTSDQNRWSYFGNATAKGELINSNFTPSKVPTKGTTLTVSTDISVRVSPPSAGGTMGEKIDALATGRTVKVIDVLQFPGANQQTVIWVNTASSN